MVIPSTRVRSTEGRPLSPSATSPPRGRRISAMTSFRRGLLCPAVARRLAFQRCRQRRADRLQPHRVFDLRPGEVGHIEGVDHLFAEGRDMGRGDIERKVRQRAGDLREQAGPVEARDLDDGKAVRQRVADVDARLDAEGFRSALRLGALLAISPAAGSCPRARPRSAARPARRAAARPRRGRIRGKSGSCPAPARRRS